METFTSDYLLKNIPFPSIHSLTLFLTDKLWILSKGYAGGPTSMKTPVNYQLTKVRMHST